MIDGGASRSSCARPACEQRQGCASHLSAPGILRIAGSAETRLYRRPAAWGQSGAPAHRLLRSSTRLVRSTPHAQRARPLLGRPNRKGRHQPDHMRPLPRRRERRRFPNGAPRLRNGRKAVASPITISAPRPSLNPTRRRTQESGMYSAISHRQIAFEIMPCASMFASSVSCNEFAADLGSTCNGSATDQPLKEPPEADQLSYKARYMRTSSLSNQAPAADLNR